MEIPKPGPIQDRVVIIGAGFAGLTLARKLAGRYFQVVLLDRLNYHQFQPLLYQVATGGLEPSSISFPLRKIFQRRPNVFLRIWEVKKINSAAKRIYTVQGELDYDHLVLAHGATTHYFGLEGVAKNVFPMKSVPEALELRNRLLEQLELALAVPDSRQRKSLLNMVIVGGGPTGVELAGALAEWKRRVLPRDYPELDVQQMDIVLLEAAPRLLRSMSPQSSGRAVRYLENLGVKVRLNTSVKDYDGSTIYLNDGERVGSKLVVWTAGVQAADLLATPALPLNRQGRVQVNAFNQVLGHPDLFAIGDCCSMEGLHLNEGHPQVAPVAIGQAKQLAENLKRTRSGKPMRSFEYRDRGRMATVGRNLALVEWGRWKMGGLPAWLIWMLVHLMSIIGVKNRLLILINWVWQYFTYDQVLRLILAPAGKERKASKKITGSPHKVAA